ncbi:MAG: outer membrane beta-barrel protein [Longimicrobiales bacterium]
MKLASRVALLALALLALRAPDGANAQTILSPYRYIETSQSIGLAGGYALTGKGAIDLGPKAGPALLARYNIRISGPFVAEAEIGILPTTRAVWDTVTADTTRSQIGESDVRLVTAMAALRFNVTGPRTWHGLLPYLILGAGIAVDAGGTSAVEEELPADVRFDFGTSFAGQLGAGAELFLSPRLSLRVDGRNVLWKIDTPAAFFTGERGRLIPRDEWTQNFYLSAGLAIHF